MSSFGMYGPGDPVLRMADYLRREHNHRQRLAEDAASAAGGSFRPGETPDFGAKAREMLDAVALELAYERLVGRG